jgi:hypothetical protein
MKSLAVMEPPARTTTVTHVELTEEECREITRAENIMLYFSARTTSSLIKNGHRPPGDWLIAEPLKVVSPGQFVTWKVSGKCEKLELFLPDVFEPRELAIKGNTGYARVKPTAGEGVYQYEAYVDGMLATGHSSPAVIIDPHH